MNLIVLAPRRTRDAHHHRRAAGRSAARIDFASPPLASRRTGHELAHSNCLAAIDQLKFGSLERDTFGRPNWPAGAGAAVAVAVAPSWNSGRSWQGANGNGNTRGPGAQPNAPSPSASLQYARRRRRPDWQQTSRLRLAAFPEGFQSSARSDLFLPLAHFRPPTRPPDRPRLVRQADWPSELPRACATPKRRRPARGPQSRGRRGPPAALIRLQPWGPARPVE